MSPTADRVRALLGSDTDAQVEQALELLAALGDSALYAELLEGWGWREGRGSLSWGGDDDLPIPNDIATEVWLNAPLDTLFPPELALAAARELSIAWWGQGSLLRKLRALPRLESLSVTIASGAPPLLLSALPKTIRRLGIVHVKRPGEVAGLERLTNLRHLALRGCLLQGAPLPPRLVGLTLGRCEGDSDLAPSLEPLPLKHLEVGIYESPQRASLGALKALRSLKSYRLNWNMLPDLAPLEGLLRLDLEGAELETLPAEIGGLSRLRWLELGENHLEDLPPEIGGLSRLRRLGLGSNPLRELPPALASLRALEALDLSYTRSLRCLPPWLPGLQRLEAIDLWFSALEELPVDMLLALPKLRRIRVPARLQERAAELASRALEEQGRHIELCIRSPLSKTEH